MQPAQSERSIQVIYKDSHESASLTHYRRNRRFLYHFLEGRGGFEPLGLSRLDLYLGPGARVACPTAETLHRSSGKPPCGTRYAGGGRSRCRYPVSVIQRARARWRSWTSCARFGSRKGSSSKMIDTASRQSAPSSAASSKRKYVTRCRSSYSVSRLLIGGPSSKFGVCISFPHSHYFGHRDHRAKYNPIGTVGYQIFVPPSSSVRMLLWFHEATPRRL